MLYNTDSISLIDFSSMYQAYVVLESITNLTQPQTIIHEMLRY